VTVRGRRGFLAVLAGLMLASAFPAPARAGAEGNLRVATALPAPGFWNGKTVQQLDGGFEYELAQRIADQIGYTDVKFSDVPFRSLVTGKAKGYDLALAQITISQKRAEVVDFTTPYYSADQGILVKQGTVVDDSNVDDLRWGVVRATVAETYLEKRVQPTKKVRSYRLPDQAFDALTAGRIDALLLDTAIGSTEARESNGALEVVGQFKSGGQYGGTVPKGSNDLQLFNEAIETLVANGTVDMLRDKWLVPEFAVDPSAVPYLEP
jgi:polar amino acid transport system substrate-binding protein